MQGTEARLVNKGVNIQEGDMGRGDVPSFASFSISHDFLQESAATADFTIQYSLVFLPWHIL